MDPRFSGFNVTTVVFAILTLWLLVARFRGLVEGNWPLFYYIGVIFYTSIFPDNLDPAWVYAGVVVTLLLRFEYMGGIFLKIIRGLDIVVLIYLLFASVASLSF